MNALPVSSTAPRANPRHGEQSAVGLRERKRLRTRDRLIAAGLDLCGSQGFTATSVEQIAASADLSPRTLNRYFATKEDIILAPIGDMVTAVTHALGSEPGEAGGIAELIDAQIDVLRGHDRSAAIDFGRLKTMNRILHDSPSVHVGTSSMNDAHVMSLCTTVADRIGSPVDDPRVRTTVTVFMCLVHIALDMWRSTACATGSDPSVCADILARTYEQFERVTKKL